MKFTDGYWLVRKGVHPLHPAEVRDVEASSAALTVYAPPKHIGDRSDTLNTGLFTVEFTAPLPDVVRVRVTRFAGQPPRPPHFPLHLAEDTAVQIEVNADHASLASGRLTVRVPRHAGWRVEFLAGDRLLTKSGFRGMGSVEVDGEGHFMHEQLQLGVGECVYGLGERFGAFVKNGQSVDIWNRDGGTASEQAYKNVPFYLTNRGYGVFVDDPGLVSFEVGSEKVARVQFSVPGQTLDYFVIYGPTPKEILEKYTALTGRPALPPAWSFGLWLSTSFTTTYDEATVTSFIQGMADRDLPLHVFHFDCFWMREFHWSDFTWDAAAFPDPVGMLQRLKARGLHICLWINPYIAQRSALFAEGMQNGYLLRRADGTVWQTDQWQAGMGIVDFTNPAAQEWFAGKLRALLDQGVDAFKTDFGERIPTDVVYHDGSDPARMHNFYSYLYNQTVFDLLREVRGEGEAVVFARAATAGGQQFPVHWGGDCESTFEAMAETLRGGLSLGLSGFGFWSHDIGGFEGTPPAAVYKRWLPFGLLCSHSRLHGSQSYRVPWLFDEEAVATLRRFTELRCRLMPYLYGQAVEAAQRGVPVLRAMLVEFPDDPACDYLDCQYMLGESLLVAPVFTVEGVVTYYVPAGRWTSLLSGAVVTGPGWVRETHGFQSLPVLVRPNTVLALGSRSDRPDYDYGDGVTLAAYELADGYMGTVTVPTVTGEPDMVFRVSREGDVITVRREGSQKAWKLLLVGVYTVAAVEGGEVSSGEEGTLVAADAEQNLLRVSLRGRPAA